MRRMTSGVTTFVPVYCMSVGLNNVGQLGINSNTDALAPTAILSPTGITAWAQVSAGGSHTCGIASTRSAMCWGACWDYERWRGL